MSSAAAQPRPASMLDGLNPAQRRAAEAVRGPVCILAGAGSGKTRTITHRIAWQVASGVARPEQILAVTFTDRAAGELRQRLRELGIPGPLRAATFHAAAWAQLRYFWSYRSDGPLPQVVTSKLPLLLPAARRLGVEARDLAAEIEWAKARRLGPADYAAHAAGRSGPLDAARMAEVFAAYETDKRQRNLVDFDDMLLLTTALLEGEPAVAAEVRDRYRYLTVDEYQDINPAQQRLLRAWLGDSDELCVVGDDDQTIYSFAGASAAYLTGFRDGFPHAKVVVLERNYRSTRQVLELANRVLWPKPAALRKRLVSQVGAGPPPEFHELADAEREVEAAVARIGRLLQAGVAPGGIAVCYRTNSQSAPYEQALRATGVPFVVRGEGGFFQRPEIRQALGLLAAAVGRPQEEAVGGPPGSPARPPRADLRVERVLREGLSWHPRRQPAGEAARERWRNLGALLEIAANAADDGAPSFADVVADLHARADAGQEAADEAGAVTLLTLHRAKGLEFDAVLLVGLEEGLVPIAHARTDDEIDEERRLLYVGVTRARRHLWLSWARQRPGYRGRAIPRRPSRFLYNLGPGAPRSGRAGAAAAAGRRGVDGGRARGRPRPRRR